MKRLGHRVSRVDLDDNFWRRRVSKVDRTTTFDFVVKVIHLWGLEALTPKPPTQPLNPRTPDPESKTQNPNSEDRTPDPKPSTPTPTAQSQTPTRRVSEVSPNSAGPALLTLEGSCLRLIDLCFTQL